MNLPLADRQVFPPVRLKSANKRQLSEDVPIQKTCAASCESSGHLQGQLFFVVPQQFQVFAADVAFKISLKTAKHTLG